MLICLVRGWPRSCSGRLFIRLASKWISFRPRITYLEEYTLLWKISEVAELSPCCVFITVGHTALGFLIDPGWYLANPKNADSWTTLEGRHALLCDTLWHRSMILIDADWLTWFYSNFNYDLALSVTSRRLETWSHEAISCNKWVYGDWTKTWTPTGGRSRRWL